MSLSVLICLSECVSVCLFICLAVASSLCVTLAYLRLNKAEERQKRNKGRAVEIDREGHTKSQREIKNEPEEVKNTERNTKPDTEIHKRYKDTKRYRQTIGVDFGVNRGTCPR